MFSCVLPCGKLRFPGGEALFSVAKDPSGPFHSGGTATVTAVGTEFNVRRGDDRVVVSVLEGRVLVQPVTSFNWIPWLPISMSIGKAPAVNAGHSAVVDHGKIQMTRALSNEAGVIEWEHGRLAFEAAPRCCRIASYYGKTNTGLSKVSASFGPIHVLVCTFGAQSANSPYLQPPRRRRPVLQDVVADHQITGGARPRISATLVTRVGLNPGLTGIAMCSWKMEWVLRLSRSYRDTVFVRGAWSPHERDDGHFVNIAPTNLFGTPGAGASILSLRGYRPTDDSPLTAPPYAVASQAPGTAAIGGCPESDRESDANPGCCRRRVPDHSGPMSS